MRIPLGWLAEYVDIPSGVSADDVQAALVRVGFEEEAVHGGELHGPVVVGQVLEFDEEPQKNGKTIRWCTVRVAPDGFQAADGGADVRGIVCGAGNFQRGDKVVVTLPGAVLPGPFAISARKTYGHVSDGMMASRSELGLGDDHSGILRLVEMNLDPEVGTNALSLLGLDDTAIEINVTPDRGYAFSLRGVAREYSHATGRVFRDPVDAVTVTRGSGFDLSIDDRAPIRGRQGCGVFVTRVIRGVDASRSAPAWMQSRLRLAGIRPISLVVDVTNYVMLELGQPTHAYDLNKLDGGIVVRRAEAGEKLTTLDDKQRELDAGDLVIADASGAIGLAGVMGGASTEIGDNTRDVLVEAANFDPVTVARTVRRHKLPSEAAKRFERGVDPTVAEAAAARVVELLVALGGGTADGLGSFTGILPENTVIDLPAGYISRLIGVTYGETEIRDALETIGCAVEGDESDGFVRVTTPPWRPDLIDKASLAEEVARICGYDRIPARLPELLPAHAPNATGVRLRKKRSAASTVLVSNGMCEVLAYPFVSDEHITDFPSLRGPIASPVQLVNPLDRSNGYLRVSLIPGLLAIAHRNVSRGLRDVSLFEVGTAFLPADGASYGVPVLPPPRQRPTDAELTLLETSVPPQPRHIAGVFVGDAWPAQPHLAATPFSWQDAIAAVEQLAYAVGSRIEVVTGSHAAYHPGRVAEIRVAGAVIGFAGEILPRLTEKFSLPRVVSAFEIDLDALIAAAPTVVDASVIRSKPPVVQDLSLLVEAAIPAQVVYDLLAETMGDLLEHIALRDDYRATGIPEGSKSLTFALRFRALDRTLTAEEANEAKMLGVRAAEAQFGAILRDVE